MAKNKKINNSGSEVTFALTTVGMSIVATLILLFFVTLNERDGPNSYTNTFDSTFFHQLTAVMLGYFVAYIFTVMVFNLALMKIEVKRMAVALAWLVMTLLFWRFAAMSLQGLDCGGRGYSSDCAHVIPSKLDNTITISVSIMLIVLAGLTYMLLRRTQYYKR